MALAFDLTVITMVYAVGGVCGGPAYGCAAKTDGVLQPL
jgi:hypothetical protein